MIAIVTVYVVSMAVLMAYAWVRINGLEARLRDSRGRLEKLVMYELPDCDECGGTGEFFVDNDYKPCLACRHIRKQVISNRMAKVARTSRLPRTADE